MRIYEALYIVNPDVGDDEIQTITNTVEKLVTDNGGSIVRSEIWGKRKLAYEVNKCSEGSYVLLRFQTEPEVLAQLDKYFKLSEQVIRSQVLLFDERTLRLEAEQERRKQAELQRQAENAAAREQSENDGDAPARRRAADDDE